MGLVAAGQAVKIGLRFVQKVDKKYNLNKIFVDKYVPPGYRKIVNAIYDVAITGGGLYALYEGLTSGTTPDIEDGFQTPVKYVSKTSPTYKTRYRQSRRYSGRCKPEYRYNRSNRYSNSRRY